MIGYFPFTISVIIPVYNADSFLDHCISSVLNQEYKNIELILVNDGSTDRSLDICNYYVQKDKRVKLFSQSNKGASAARNLGIENATGDYISFVDADDWIEPDRFSLCKDYLINEVDIVIYSESNKLQLNTVFDERYIVNDLLPAYIGSSRGNIPLPVLICSLLVKRDIITNISFSSITFMEDRLFFLETLMNSKTAVVIHNESYHYRENPTSLTSNYNHNFVKDLTEANKKIIHLLKQYNLHSSGLMYFHINTICRFAFFLLKYELNLRVHRNVIKDDLTNYYIGNNLKVLLTWGLTIRLMLRNPKWILVKLRYFDSLLYLYKAKRI